MAVKTNKTFSNISFPKPKISDVRTAGLTGVGHKVVVSQTNALGRSSGARTVGHGHDV